MGVDCLADGNHGALGVGAEHVIEAGEVEGVLQGFPAGLKAEVVEVVGIVGEEEAVVVDNSEVASQTTRKEIEVVIEGDVHVGVGEVAHQPFAGITMKVGIIFDGVVELDAIGQCNAANRNCTIKVDSPGEFVVIGVGIGHDSGGKVEIDGGAGGVSGIDGGSGEEVLEVGLGGEGGSQFLDLVEFVGLGEHEEGEGVGVEGLVFDVVVVVVGDWDVAVVLGGGEG